MRFEQRFEGVAGVSHVNIWRKSVVGRGTDNAETPRQERIESICVCMWRVRGQLRERKAASVATE